MDATNISNSIRLPRHNMIPRPKTLRGQLSLMIAIMSGVGLVCSIFVVNIFLDQILKDQKLATLELVQHETLTQTEQHKKMMETLGLRVQKNEVFRKAILNRNQSEIQNLLNEEFSQDYVGFRAVNLNKIYVFDLSFNQIAESTEGDINGANKTICDQLPTTAKNRKGIDRIKTISSFCFHQSHSFQSVIVPIGTLLPIGYIQIISEPYNFFSSMENKLAMPLQITSASNQLNYQSENWIPHTDSNFLKIKHVLNDITHQPSISILFQKDISQTRQSFSQTRTLIIIFIVAITCIAVFLFLFIFEKSLLIPLNRLGKQLNIVKNDKKNFGKELQLTGSPEIVALTENFNGLTNKLSKLYNKMEDLAFKDQLTSLPNRSRLQEILQFHTLLNQKKGTPFALFMMDLDRFKSVNDTLGHKAGDLLLLQVSDRLEAILRKSDYFSKVTDYDASYYHTDIVARLGGDEFAAVLPAMGNVEDAEKLSLKILDAMKDPFIVDDFSFSVGVSIGIAMCPMHGTNAEVLMQHADVAMYQAKDTHKGYSFYNSKLDKFHVNALTLDADLRTAIKNDTLSLAYQPKIDLRANRVVGVEALLRWVHEKHGFIPPDKFIPVAEQSGLINDITEWVIEKSLYQKSLWEKQGIDLSMAINLSAKNLLDKCLVSSIRNQLQKTSVDPESFYLELTETAVMSDPTHAIIVLRQLYDMGVRISIDDFGTGYSSLSYLKQLPVDEIKIDRSFVMDMEHDGNDAIIVQSTIDLAHNMGLRVIAEGVESQFVLEELSGRSCDLAQGYFMAKPMSAVDLLRWMEHSPWGIKQRKKA